MSTPFNDSVRPVAPWIGGKRNLSRRIIERIGAIPHDLYAEPFVGMGGVFLRRPERARVEVVNDRSRDVANFFRVLQRHYIAFLDMIRFQITTRVEFERLIATDPDTLIDLERAARFLYLQRLAFGGKVAGRSFGVSSGTPARFDVTKLTPMLEDLHIRLAPVTIECLDYADFLRRYDRPDALFYCDPPYFGSEGDYGKELFARSDFERLAEALAAVKGRFLLSLNDHPEVRRIFGRFAFEAVETSYSISSTKHLGRSGELIIAGP